MNAQMIFIIVKISKKILFLQKFKIIFKNVQLKLIKYLTKACRPSLGTTTFLK
jgi:hypothetical protein